MAQTKASLIDLNSNELILDLDGDTTLHSSTDDQIDIKIAGADDFTFTAGAFNILASSHAVFADSSEAKFGAGTDLQIYHDGTNSFIANKTGALKIATETSGIAITIGHTTSEVTVADNLTVTGNANIGGSLTFADGSIALADLDIDGATDIGAAIVDADLFIIDDGAGGTNRKVAASRIKTYIGSTTAVDDLTLGDAAVTIATSSGNITIDAQAGDTDIIFKGTDSSSDITALTLDMSDAGTAVFNHDIRIADDGQIGSASDADAIVINSSGVVTMNQIPVFSAGLNVSGGTIAGTLSTAAQTNITSLGTLTALTVDDVAIDGKVITMTGSSSDTAVITAGTNGTLSIVTTDDAAAAANIQITADGTFEVDGTTITLDSAGDIVFDAGGNDFNLKAGGTEVLRISNSSSDVIIKPIVDAKDIIFQQRDGTEVARIEDNATFNVVTGKLAINGTAITSTAAELNIVDGDTSATSTTIADADRVVVNDNGTMVQVAVTDLSAYFDDEITAMPNLVTVGAAGTATTLAGIPHLTEDTSIYIGSSPTSSSDTAADNVAVGMSAMDAITTGDKNIAIGKNAAGVLTTGDRNVFIGDSSGDAATAASQNTGIGNDAFTSLTDGDHNVGIGVNVFAALTTGHRNISIGQTSSDGFDTEDDNLAIGTGALGGPVAGGEYNVAIGNNSLDALTSGDENIAIGYNAGTALTSGGSNVFVGNNAAGTGVVTGANNIGIGANSCENMTSGNTNVGIGARALHATTTGVKNTCVGMEAGEDMVSAQNATLMGYRTGYVNTAHECTAFGSEAALANTSGAGITAIGREAYKTGDDESHNMAIGLQTMDTGVNGGEYNVAVGNFALKNLTSADFCTAVGYNAGNDITTGGYNTFIGHQSGDANTSGNTNTAVGHGSLGTNTVGDRNTAVGSGALGTFNPGSNTDDSNTAVGYAALNELTTGIRNIAFGGLALGGAVTTEGNNMAIGFASMSANVAGGEYNVGVGNLTLGSLTSADYCTALGHEAGSNIAASDGQNTVIGYQAGTVITTGGYNTIVGAQCDTSNNNTANAIVIGQNIATVSNRVAIGKSGGLIYADFNSSASWTQSSDERLKDNITATDLGLEFINELRPVTYKWKDTTTLPAELHKHKTEINAKNTETLQYGLIAQEVKSAMDKVGHDKFTGWDLDEDDAQSIREGQFIYPLIKAMQELSAKVDALTARVTTLEG